MTGLARRAVVAGAGLAAAATAGVGGSTVSAQAAAPPAGKQAPSFYRYKVGTHEVTVVSDGARSFPLEGNLVVNAKIEDVSKALEAAYMPKDQMTIVFNPIVVNTGSKLVLIDTGNGPGAFRQSNGQIGATHANLAAAGVDPATIDIVIISHFHGDHINGLVTADGKPAFPNAEITVPAAEWKYWMDDGEMARAPKGRIEGLFKSNRTFFEPLKSKVTQYDWKKEIAPGITAIESVGHTPGHTSFVISSGGKSVFVQSDVTNHPALFVRNPGWHGFFDQDPAKAEETRRKVYDMVVAEKFPVQGFHYPFPALGHVEKDGSGYRYIPAAWNPTL